MMGVGGAEQEGSGASLETRLEQRGMPFRERSWDKVANFATDVPRRT